MGKTCFKCGITKDFSEFYKHKEMKDGYLGKCKSCTKKDTKENTEKKMKDPFWAEKEKIRHREKYHRLNYLEKHKPSFEYKSKVMREYKKRYPEKYIARIKSQKVESNLGHNHHWSYNEQHQMDVIDMTPKDHFKAHRFIKYDSERMMYRTLEGILLDTKESHLAYITKMINERED